MMSGKDMREGEIIPLPDVSCRVTKKRCRYYRVMTAAEKAQSPVSGLPE